MTKYKAFSTSDEASGPERDAASIMPSYVGRATSEPAKDAGQRLVVQARVARKARDALKLHQSKFS
jgi:hypothetical protein